MAEVKGAITKKPGHNEVSGSILSSLLRCYAVKTLLKCLVIFDFKLPALFL